MKTTLTLFLRFFVLGLAWFKFQYNTVLNYSSWYWMIYKANRYHKKYKLQFFVIPKSKTSLTVVNHFFVGRYNAIRRDAKLADKEKFDQFKMKKITVNTLIDKAYYKTKL